MAKRITSKHLKKCIESLIRFNGGYITIPHFSIDKHYCLIMNTGKKIENCILCTPLQSQRLIKYSFEEELLPTIGIKYHFNKEDLQKLIYE